MSNEAIIFEREKAMMRLLLIKCAAIESRRKTIVQKFD